MKQQPERTENCECKKHAIPYSVAVAVTVTVLVSGPGKRINEVFMWLPGRRMRHGVKAQADARGQRAER